MIETAAVTGGPTSKKQRATHALIVALLLALCLMAVGATTARATGGGFITNGTITLGVHDEGHLNVGGGPPSSGGVDVVGLRYNPTTAEFTAPGCLCEGWGAADAISGTTGSANEEYGIHNLTLVSRSFSASSAQSIVDVGELIRVTHDYHPSAVPELYEVTVTIENIGDAAIDPRYRRVMDWDVEPTAFSEYVTIQGTEAAEDVLFASDDGFASADPLSGTPQWNFSGDAVDDGPSDHGALFDFGFDELEPGASHSFNIFYGGAATEQAADDALAAVGAEVFSYGQPSTEGGPDRGEPNTAIFAFAGVGGEAQFPAAQFTAETYSVNESAGEARIALELTAPSETPLKVRVVSTDGSAIAGSDYTPIDDIAAFDADTTTAVVTVPILDDGDDEPDETLTLRLLDTPRKKSDSSAALGDPIEATLTIVDDDETTGPGEDQKCPGFEDDSRPQIVGTPGHDTLVGTGDAEVICGLAGNDTIRGGGGDDHIIGGAGNDVIRAEAGADTVMAGPGVDYVEGNDGPDILSGGRDNDQLRGGKGDDTLRGDHGFDILAGEQGADTIDGGSERDKCITDGDDPAPVRCP